MSGEIRFAVVDDHPMFRAGVIHTLAQAGLTCVAEGAAPEEAVQLAGERAPDVILLDIDRAGLSLAAVRTLAASAPGVRLLLLAEAPDQEQVVAALRAGANGYAPKSLTGLELVESVRWWQVHPEAATPAEVDAAFHQLARGVLRRCPDR